MLNTPDMYIKFFVVMPVSENVYGSEGIPLEFPHKKDVEVFYTQAAAEKSMLELQQAIPHLQFVVLEAITTCARHHDRNVFSVVETKPWF